MTIAFLLGLRNYDPKTNTFAYRLIALTFLPVLLHHIDLIGFNGRLAYLGCIFIYPLLTFFAFGEKEGPVCFLLALGGVAIVFVISDLSILEANIIKSLKLQSLIAFVCKAAMALIYEIVRRSPHAMYIEVESSQGQGTCFSIFLPASETTIQRSVESNGHVVRGSGTILLVDDEE
ncbi:MAG: hypothetical protein JRF72_08410, partial [Deltaproteobacteria bacterium]|nr:hypothetical protein [Deltaproteobacteria bacterium]